MEVSTTAEFSATNATAAHTEEEPMHPSPVAAASTPGAETKASGGEEARPSFIDLVFDTILLEESTLHRSRSAPIRGINNSNKPILVPLFYTRLARAFEIAQEVCRAYHEVHPKHGVSALAESELEDAGLEDVERVKMYVRDIGGCNGYFLDAEDCRGGGGTILVAKAVRVDQDGDHGRRDGNKGDLQQEHAQEQGQEADSGVEAQDHDHSDQQQDHDEDRVFFVKAGIVFPSGRLSDSDSYSIPALNEVQIKEFNDRYGQVHPEYQDMVARVLFRLRKDYWNRTITTSDLDRSEPELLMPYGSRYAQRRREIQARKQAEKAMGSSDAVLNHAAAQHLGEISQRLKGLQIVEAGGKGGKCDRKPTYGLQGLFDLPLVVPAEDAFKTVGDGIMELYRRLVPSQEYMTRRTKLVQKLQGILNAGFPGQRLRLEVFGSYASGLGSESSDADLCITTDHFQQTASYNNVRAVANVLRRGGMMQVQPITNARVPIVKFIDPVTKTNCDVNTNHVLGIYNSELIRCYTMIDDRVRPFLYSLKALVKKHGINDSSQSWLSSYAYVMMAIGFLQAQEPPVLPALQMQPESQMTELYVQMNHEGRGGKDVINCAFDRDPGRYKDFGAANTKSVGQLLIEFFEFYSRFYDYQTMEVNVRVGGGVRVREELTKARKNGNPNVKPPLRGRGEKKLIVMDPFIRDRNVAGSCSGRHLVRVWTIFESLYLTLSRGDFQGAFETISRHDNDDEEFARGRYPPGGRKGGLTPAQERMVAAKQAHAAAQVRIAAVRPRTPVQVQQAPPIHPQIKTAVIPVQAQGQGQGKTVNGTGATDTHRSREKKTERKLERKESRREQRESHKSSRDHQAGSSTSSSRNIPSSIASTPATAGVTQQPVQEPAVVQVVASIAVITSGHTDGKSNATAAFGAGDVEEGAVDGDDDAGDDNDSQQGGPDGESKSRKRRQRRSVARTLHSATVAASTGVAGTAASDSVAPAPVHAPAPPHGGTASEGAVAAAVAAAVFASAVARATNSVNLKQNISQQPVAVGTGSNDTTQLISTSANNNKNKSTQQPLGDQFAQQLQQKHMQIQQQLLAQQAQKKQQKQQKQLNKQLSRQMNKQQQGQQQGLQEGQQQQQQQQQQLNPQFPVLAKTHKLLLGKTKEGGIAFGGAGGAGGGHKNKDVANGNNSTSGNGTPATSGGAASTAGGGSKRNSRIQPKPQPQSVTPKSVVATAAAHEQ